MCFRSLGPLAAVVFLMSCGSTPRPATVHLRDVETGGCGRSAKYPQAALEAGVSGTVELVVHVDSDGRVSRASVRKGLGYGLDEAALDAIRACRFAPAIASDGRRVAVDIPYSFSFELSRQIESR